MLVGGVLSKKEMAVYGGLIFFVQKEHGGARAKTSAGCLYACIDFGPGSDPESSLNLYVSCMWKVW